MRSLSSFQHERGAPWTTCILYSFFNAFRDDGSTLKQQLHTKNAPPVLERLYLDAASPSEKQRIENVSACCILTIPVLVSHHNRLHTVAALSSWHLALGHHREQVAIGPSGTIAIGFFASSGGCSWNRFVFVLMCLGPGLRSFPHGRGRHRQLADPRARDPGLHRPRCLMHSGPEFLLEAYHLGQNDYEYQIS